MTTSRFIGSTYRERSELQRRRAPGREPRPLSARQAVRERMAMGPPTPEGGHDGVRKIMLQYEPGIAMLGELGWTPTRVWKASMCCGLPTDTITASMVVAIIDISWLIIGSRDRFQWLSIPTWIDGERTDLGARFDQLMPGLNIHFWQAGLDSQHRRRYCESHGRDTKTGRRA